LFVLEHLPAFSPDWRRSPRENQWKLVQIQTKLSQLFELLSSRVEISPELSLLLIAPQRHSIGLRSGELAGHCGKSYRLQKERPESMHSCDSLHDPEQNAAGIRRMFLLPFSKIHSIPEPQFRHMN
jgi:hypothetical protein